MLSVLLYGAESWTTAFHCRRKIETFHMKCLRLRKISHVSIWDQDRWHLNNQKLRQFLGVPTIVQLISQARLRWLGHLARMGPKRLPKRLLFGFLPGDIHGRTDSCRSQKWKMAVFWISSTIWSMLGFHCTLGCRRHEKTQAWIREVLFTPWPCGFRRCNLVLIERYLPGRQWHRGPLNSTSPSSLFTALSGLVAARTKWFLRC